MCWNIKTISILAEYLYHVKILTETYDYNYFSEKKILFHAGTNSRMPYLQIILFDRAENKIAVYEPVFVKDT